MSQGCVYLVGAGPGDPGLITVRGRELISQADVIVYDYLAAPKLLTWARPDAERIYVGKKAGAHTLKQEEINALLVSLAQKGSTVVRLKGGDPYVFGRGGEEALDLVAAGIPFEVVPGVTSGIAAACYAGIPVTHRKLASNLGLITGHETPDKEDSDLDYAALARWNGTLEFYMGVANLRPICDGLIAEGLDPETPAALIRWGTTSRQRVVTGTAGTLPDVAEQAGIQPPAMIVIGKVISLREKLNWFERRPLFGRRIVVTRARAQASKLTAGLEALGAEVIETPTIRIERPDDPGPLAEAVEEIASYGWVVLTSANGVRGFVAALYESGRDVRALSGVRLCAVGSATAGCLEQFGLRADIVPADYSGAGVVAAFESQEGVSEARILCPRARVAPQEMIEALSAIAAEVREVAAYQTVPDGAGAEQVAELLTEGDLHWITFTSSSTVKNFFDVVDAGAVRDAGVQLASIGPSTTATLEEFGFTPTVQADPHTIDGLLDAVRDREQAD